MAGIDSSAPQNPAHGFYYKTVPHITLKSIAQNKSLDPIFAKHEPILATRLAELNAALAALAEQQASSLRQKLAAKLMAKHFNEGANAVTDADYRRCLLPGTDPRAHPTKQEGHCETGPGLPRRHPAHQSVAGMGSALRLRLRLACAACCRAHCLSHRLESQDG